MVKEKFPVTPAVRALKEHKADFILHMYKFQEKGGTSVAAKELGVDEHQVIKTLVMEDEEENPFLMLMHGDREVSTKTLARTRGVKTVSPCTPEIAHKHTGYMVGGISPFGTRKSLKVYAEASIFDLPRIYINAGKKGLLAEISPGELKDLLKPIPVTVAV
ncbi:MAG: aminoacyl-tRNA deacylase [Desulfobacterales bacterium]|nr:aminoacyl-tRNA deacylase [Desulfobacterales bacterium]